MGIPTVDRYMRDLPIYWKRALTMRAEKIWQARHDYLYRESIRDFDDRRRPHPIATTLSGDPATWRYIDFDPYEAWLGRRNKDLLNLRVETWECDKHIWDSQYREEDY